MLPIVMSLCLIVWTGWNSNAFATVEDIECGSLDNAFGPFDYRTASTYNKNLVEIPHFNDQYMAVMRGQTRARGNEVMDDLHYTLRVFPNHHGSLVAIDRLGRLMKSEKPHPRAYKLECYYIRGIRMAKDDPVVYYLFGLYLQHRGRKAEARQKIEYAVELFDASEENISPNLLYNLGLVFFEFGAYDKAADYAQQAAERGFDLPGLINKLKKIGRWQEPLASKRIQARTAAQGQEVEPQAPPPAPEAELRTTE